MSVLLPMLSSKKLTGKTGHIHAVGALDLGDNTVSGGLGHQGSEKDNSRVMHCGRGGWFGVLRLEVASREGITND